MQKKERKNEMVKRRNKFAGNVRSSLSGFCVFSSILGLIKYLNTVFLSFLLLS